LPNLPHSKMQMSAKCKSNYFHQQQNLVKEVCRILGQKASRWCNL